MKYQENSEVKMTKEVSKKGAMGPFGDAERINDKVKKDKKTKESLKNDEVDKNNAKNKARSRSNADRLRRTENSRQIKEYEMREQERRERYEREAAEQERMMKEREFERWERERSRSRSKNGNSLSRYKPRRPPAGYKDPHEVCRQALPRKVKEKKREEIKALMNCIAFTPSQTDLSAPPPEEPRKVKLAGNEEMDNSSGSDSTSITDVTPRSSSSGCSSMSKQSVCVEKGESGAKEKGSRAEKGTLSDKIKGANEEGPKKPLGKSADGEEQKKKEDQPDGEARKLTEVELEELKYMQDAFEDLDLDEETSDFASSIISGLSEERRAKSNRRNMTFTNEQLREIERVNLILLKKIMHQKNGRVKPPTCQPPVIRKTSAAINRSRMEEKIERENRILLKKLQSAKGTTGTLSRKNSQSNCY